MLDTQIEALIRAIAPRTLDVFAMGPDTSASHASPHSHSPRDSKPHAPKSQRFTPPLAHAGSSEPVRER